MSDYAGDFENVDLSEDFMLRYGRFQMLKLYEKSYDEALEICKEIIKKNDKYIEAYILQAEIYLKLNDFVMIDCQFHTNHLESMGGEYISWEEYKELLSNIKN